MTKQYNSQSSSKLLFNKNYQLFLNFLNHTSQVKNILKYMASTIPSYMQKLHQNIPLEYLDIGCGHGDKTLSIINLLQQTHTVNTTAIDPSPELLAIFKNQHNGNCAKLTCSTWEGYKPTKKFHFITSIHTFYYIQNWKSAIKKMLNHLSNNGVIAIVIRANDEIHQFKNYFFNKIYSNHKKEVNFELLCKTLTKLNINYETQIIESNLNMNGCLLENKAGKQLIEFFLRLPYSDIPENIKLEIKEYLEQHQHNGHLINQDGFV